MSMDEAVRAAVELALRNFIPELRAVIAESHQSRAEAPQYVSIQKVAATMNVSSATVQRWVRSGRLRAAKVGTRWRVCLDDLQRFVTEAGHEHRAPDPEEAALALLKKKAGR